LLVRVRQEIQEVLRRRAAMTRNKRDPNSWMVVRLPEQALSERILHLAAPLLEHLGPTPAPDEARRVIELATRIWNAHVIASPLWGNPKRKPLAELRRSMQSSQAPPGLADTFERLSARWRSEFSLDPRLVAEWSFEGAQSGTHELVCATTLPEGVKADAPPPTQKRIAISGRFLDDVRIRLGPTSSLSFPVEHHRGQIGSDGVVTVHAKMPTVVVLFAEGVLKPIDGAPVEVIVGGKRLGPLVLRDLRCAGDAGHNDIAVLVFSVE
jgi:hypothetical protein